MYDDLIYGICSKLYYNKPIVCIAASILGGVTGDDTEARTGTPIPEL